MLDSALSRRAEQKAKSQCSAWNRVYFNMTERFAIRCLNLLKSSFTGYPQSDLKPPGILLHPRLLLKALL